MLLSDKSPVTEATAEEHIVHSNLLSAKEKTTSYVNGYCDDMYTVSRVNVPVHHDLYQNVLNEPRIVQVLKQIYLDTPL